MTLPNPVHRPTALAFILLLPAMAAGQTPIDALAPGDTIRMSHIVETLRSRGGAVVNATTLRVREGALVSLDPVTLLLHGEYELTAVPRSTIRELDVQRGTRPGSATRGALWGGLIGAAAGAIFATAASGSTDNPGYGTNANWIGAGAGAGLLLGAGIGAIVNSLRSVPNWENVELTP